MQVVPEQYKPNTELHAFEFPAHDTPLPTCAALKT